MGQVASLTVTISVSKNAASCAFIVTRVNHINDPRLNVIANQHTRRIGQVFMIQLDPSGTLLNVEFDAVFVRQCLSVHVIGPFML